ncbi:MAG: galactose-1-phosphate uridylyltransferase, partial [Rubrobacteraceae bacterium]
QIYGYPFVPPVPRKELEAAREYRRRNNSFLHEDLLAAEHADGRRVVAKAGHFTAFVPFYAHYPYEVHIYSRRPAQSIADLSEEERRDLAHVLKRVLSGYDELFGFSLPYVMAMHQAPTDGEDYTGIAHFHIEFYPPNRTKDKLKCLAGSEVGAGAFVMDALPEDTAKTLREAVDKAEE